MTVQPPRRFLTIGDYSDPMKAYADCLAQLRSLHGNVASDSASKDKRRALYLLSRAAIDSGCAAFELLERRHIPAIYQIGRHILEIRALIEYFDPEDWVSGLTFSEFELLFREKETTGGWEFKVRCQISQVVASKGQAEFPAFGTAVELA